MNVNLKSLIGKLTDSSRRALESAAGLCLSRTHYEVEPEHWIVKLIEPADGDIAKVLARFEINRDRVQQDLERALGSFKTGNGKSPSLSPDIEDLVRDGWLFSSVNAGVNKVRSGALLLAALSHRTIGRRLRESSKELERINVDSLSAEFGKIVKGSPEDREVLAESYGTRREVSADAPTAGAETPALDQFTVNLTETARAGKIDPVLGRDAEIRNIVDILMRRRQNNPILTGEAGVGKTAVVEGFARRIALGDVPDPIKNVDVRTLDLGLLQAGAGVKGEFENRLKQVIEEVRASSRPIILFIDEAHQLIGAGGDAGQNDAANLLKPALARGELRTIAATTWAEYKKYFEKDAALTRRFQVVRIEEPDEKTGIVMMRAISGMLTKHHKVPLRDDAIAESVRLSMRYIPARQLPDKSVSVLDTACAKVAIGQAAVPASVEDLRRRLDAIDSELSILGNEEAIGHDHRERTEALNDAKAAAETELKALEEHWESEKELVAQIVELQSKLTGQAPTGEEVEKVADAERDAVVKQLEERRAALAEIQGDSPLVQAEVDGQTVAEVISAWTGIPVGKMVADEINAILELPTRLSERVLGQDHALEAIAKRIRTSRAKLDNPSRPVGVFMLVGPSGVGKTETGLALAEALYGGERNIVTINMSEYQESHTVSSLKGSPPGYVGYGEGGVLTEAVRRRPYSVVLLDEVEKAHPDVMELFFQVFDKGILEDGEGREIDFRNTVILLTSNVGSDTIMGMCADPETVPEADVMIEAVRPQLLQKFPAALLGRMVSVAYYPILPHVLRKIVQLQLQRIVDRVRQNHGVEMIVGDELVGEIVNRCQEPESGARNVDRILTHTLLPSLSTEFLKRMMSKEPMSRATVTMDESGEFGIAID